MKRRTFLRTTAIGAAAAATAPMILTSCSTIKGANDRINFGHIGLGNRGTDELTSYFLRWPDQIRSVAFCDVFKSRRENALGLAQKAYQERNIKADLKTCNEFERILERKDIDAVAITTPDHWHVPLAIRAAQAGKHLHVAKPLDIMVMGIKDLLTGSYTCEGKGGYWAPGGIWDTVNTWDVNCEYANGLKLHFMSDEIAQPLVMKYRPKWDGNGTTFFGTRGWISLGRSSASSNIPEIHQALNKSANSDGWINGEGAQLVKIFTETIKGNVPELSPLDEAVLSDTISHMGNIAIRTGRKISWDPIAETTTGDPEAMKMFVREHRKPW